MVTKERSVKPSGHEGGLYLDGGWAWAVTLASFLSNALIGSIYFGYGILLPEWMSEFQSSSALTSFVGSTTAGVISGSGPFASYLILKWGCRTSHVLGGMTIAVALCCCCFASTMLQIFIFYSVFAGIGGGLCYVPSVITISEYFKKKRSVAIGIVCSGIGCGSFIFPVFYEYLIGEYGWRGVMLIAGGLNLHMVAFGLVMCPVEKAPELNLCTCLSTESESSGRKKTLIVSDVNSNIVTKYEGGFQRNRRRSSFQLMRAWLKNPLTRRKSSLAKLETTSPEVVDDNDDVFNIESTILEENEDIEASGLLPNATETSDEKESYFQQLVKLFKKISFHILIFHNITMFFGMMIVFGLTPLRAVTDNNMTTAQGALLVSIMGFSNLFGRFIWGFIASSKNVRTTWLFITLRLAAGLLTIASPLSTSFSLSAAYCALAGLTLGNWSLYPVVVAEQFGDQLLTVAYGYLEAANGVGCVIGPLVGGYLYDVTRTYRYSYIASGSSLILGVMPLVAILLWKKRMAGKLDAHLVQSNQHSAARA